MKRILDLLTVGALSFVAGENSKTAIVSLPPDSRQGQSSVTLMGFVFSEVSSQAKTLTISIRPVDANGDGIGSYVALTKAGTTTSSDDSIGNGNREWYTLNTPVLPTPRYEVRIVTNSVYGAGESATFTIAMGRPENA